MTPLIAALIASVKHPGGFADIKRRQIQTTLFIGSVQLGTSDRKKKRLPHIFASITSGKRTDRKCLKDGRKNLVGDCANPQSHISDGPIRFSTAQQYTAATCWRQASAVAFSLNSGQSQLDQSESTSPTAGSAFTFTLTIEAAPLLKKRPLLQQRRRRPGSVPLQQAIVLLPLPVFFCGFCERLGAAASRSRVLSSASPHCS